MFGWQEYAIPNGAGLQNPVAVLSVKLFRAQLCRHPPQGNSFGAI